MQNWWLLQFQILSSVLRSLWSFLINGKVSIVQGCQCSVLKMLYSAIEYFSWLLYYSVPILRDILSDEYFNHYCLLVISLHILLSDNITEDMLLLAEESLHKFYLQFPNLYSESFFMIQITNFIVLHLNRCWTDFNECTSFKPFSALYKSLGSNMDHVMFSIWIDELCAKETLSWNERSCSTGII